MPNKIRSSFFHTLFVFSVMCSHNLLVYVNRMPTSIHLSTLTYLKHTPSIWFGLQSIAQHKYNTILSENACCCMFFTNKTKTRYRTYSKALIIPNKIYVLSVGQKNATTSKSFRWNTFRRWRDGGKPVTPPLSSACIRPAHLPTVLWQWYLPVHYGKGVYVVSHLVRPEFQRRWLRSSIHR